jgi:biopolymer transport protein ExbD
MTRRQVRAAMRRLRDHAEEAEEDNGEINLVPYLDIVTNIIIFLLASVVYNVALGNVNVSLPAISSGGGAAAEEPERPPLNLTVNAGNSGFTIGASGGILPQPIPKQPNGDYDYKALTEKLMEIKKEYADETKATFNADAHIPYEIVIKTLDAIREDTASKPLFPDILFSAGVL